MSIPIYPEFFNDVFGPIMQPGSSSHTAAPCRLGYLARSLLGEPPARIEVLLDQDGSFAGTFGLMYEDQAMLAGAQGLLPDDPRLFEAAAMARAAGITTRFQFGEMRESTHINAMKYVLTGRSGRVATLVGDSTGGGMIETVRVDGYPLRVKGDCHVLLVFDRDERLAAEAFAAIAEGLPGLLETGASRAEGQGVLHFAKTAEPPDLAAVGAALAGTPGVRIACLAPVLPVITRPGRRPQLFRSMTEWRELARDRGLPLWEVAVQYEIDASGWTRNAVLDFMRMIAAKMRRQTHAAYEDGVVVPASPFKPNLAAQWETHRRSPRRLTDDLTARTLSWAFGAGAGIPGVETVPGPMGSGGGYIYAALHAVQEAKGFGDDDVLHGLFVAAGIGAIAYTRTEPTGEVIGCSGECGISGAMAAAAIAEMAGGAPAEVENAASLALQASIGWPCDPIPGGQGQPCRSRILAATCMAHVFADLALAGREAVLPLHEAIDVADAIGRRLSADLLCTSRGGAAVAPAALRQGAAYREWIELTAREQRARPPGNLI
jgi:L-serine dehydratase